MRKIIAIFILSLFALMAAGQTGGQFNGTGQSYVNPSPDICLDNVIRPTLNASVNNWNPAGFSSATNRIMINGGGGGTKQITGIESSGWGEGCLLHIVNVSGRNYNFINNSAASLAANRFQLGSNITINPYQALTLVYDSVLSRWIILSTTN